MKTIKKTSAALLITAAVVLFGGFLAYSQDRPTPTPPLFPDCTEGPRARVWGLARFYGQAVNLLYLCNRITTPAVPIAIRFNATAHVSIELAAEILVPFPKGVIDVRGNARICITIRTGPCRFLLHTKIVTPFAPAAQQSAFVFTH